MNIMNGAMKAEILDAEERLRIAMLNSDIGELDKLLAPDLIFTNHLGQLQGKEDDLALHKAGTLRLQDMKPSEQYVRSHGEVAIVTVRMRLAGIYDGAPLEGDFRFTRVWAPVPDNASWQIVAAHSTLLCGQP